MVRRFLTGFDKTIRNRNATVRMVQPDRTQESALHRYVIYACVLLAVGKLIREWRLRKLLPSSLVVSSSHQKTEKPEINIWYFPRVAIK